MTEQAWTRKVIEIAKLHGWMCCHFDKAQVADGDGDLRWVTALWGDIGCPDIIAVKNGRVILAELKTDDPKSKTTPGQARWLAEAGPNGYLWRPADVLEVVRVFAGAAA